MSIIKKTRIFFLCLLFLFALETQASQEETTEEQLDQQITDWQARLEYARLLSNLHRYDESLAQLQQLLDQKPQAKVVLIEIAQVYYYQGKKAKALQLLEQIPVHDLNDKTRSLMADIYVALKKYTKAEKIYRELLKKTPDNDITKLKLAELLSWQKKYAESVVFYEQILAKRPNDIQVRRKYAMVLMWMGHDGQAAEELEKTLFPKSKR